MNNTVSFDLDDKHLNMLNNILEKFECNYDRTLAELIESYYNRMMHPTVKVEHLEDDSDFLDDLELSEKDAILIKETLKRSKQDAMNKINSIKYKEEDKKWWSGGCKVTAEYAANLLYTQYNTIKSCENIINALDKLVEQRKSYILNLEDIKNDKFNQ